jgi:carbamate kinase
MGPKVEALCRFVDSGGRLGAIGALADAADLLAGTAGTSVSAPDPMTFGPTHTSQAAGSST